MSLNDGIHPDIKKALDYMGEISEAREALEQVGQKANRFLLECDGWTDQKAIESSVKKSDADTAVRGLHQLIEEKVAQRAARKRGVK